MAHTISREQRQRRLRAEPLSSWRGWLVYVRCVADHPPSTQPLDALLALPNPPATVGDLLRRLRCRQCGKPPAGVALRQSARSQVWMPLKLPAHLEEQSDGMPGTARVAWWRR